MSDTVIVAGVSHLADVDYMQTLSFTIDEEVADALRERAEQQGGRSVSSIIREAIEEKLGREPQTEEEEA